MLAKPTNQLPAEDIVMKETESPVPIEAPEMKPPLEEVKVQPIQKEPEDQISLELQPESQRASSEKPLKNLSTMELLQHFRRIKEGPLESPHDKGSYQLSKLEEYQQIFASPEV